MNINNATNIKTNNTIPETDSIMQINALRDLRFMIPRTIPHMHEMGHKSNGLSIANIKPSDHGGLFPEEMFASKIIHDTIIEMNADIIGEITFNTPCTVKDVDLSFIRTPFLLVFRNIK